MCLWYGMSLSVFLSREQAGLVTIRAEDLTCTHTTMKLSRVSFRSLGLSFVNRFFMKVGENLKLLVISS